MTPQEKKELSEIDICDLFITPAIKDAGWDQFRQIRREVTLTPDPWPRYRSGQHVLATAQATQLNLADSLVEQAIG